MLDCCCDAGMKRSFWQDSCQVIYFLVGMPVTNLIDVCSNLIDVCSKFGSGIN
jgi:hypothetical protein